MREKDYNIEDEDDCGTAGDDGRIGGQKGFMRILCVAFILNFPYCILEFCIN